MASVPTNAVELLRLDQSDSLPPPILQTAEQSVPGMSYYSNSMSPTAQATPPIYDGPLSPAAPLSGFSDYSPYSPGPTFYPAVTPSTPTFNPYADNFLPATVQQLMPSSSWVNPIDVFAAALLHPDFDRVSLMRASAGEIANPSGSLDGLEKLAIGNDLQWSRVPSPKPPRQPMQLEPTLKTAPCKRSRTAQACERCRIRKAKCFGGSPCNRCVKRKFDCEFNPTRQRGPHKPRSSDSPTHGIILHGQAKAHQVHTTTMAKIMPDPVTPSLGLGLELNPVIDEDADGERDPDVCNVSSAPLSDSHSSTLSGSGMGSTITIPAINTTHDPWYAETDGDLPLYSRMGEEMTFSSSEEASGSHNDIDGPCDYLFTPLTPTIPPSWVEINTSHNQGNAPPSAATGRQADCLSSSTSSLPSSGLNVDDLLLSVQAEHLVDIHFDPLQQLYPGAVDWIPHPQSVPSPTL